jgi:hypothetical protein
MSRFLSSFRRLQKKLVKLEMNNLSGNVGPALAHYAATKELPEQPWLRARVQWHLDISRVMHSSVPRPLPEDKGAENS